jgi:flagellar basal-body rod protein FlgB
MELPVADRITSLLTTFLDVQSRRAEVVSSNIANADTPGYAAKELDFADYLRRAAHQALAPQGPSGAADQPLDSPRVIEQAISAVGIDGNTVDMGREMAALADSGMQYLAGTQLLQLRLRTLRAAIREGR